LKKCRKLHPQGQGRPPGGWNIIPGYIAVSKLLESDFDLGPAVRIISECGHEFLMDLFELQFFVQKYLIRNFCSSFSIYRR
jgi:hypothetical protein